MDAVKFLPAHSLLACDGRVRVGNLDLDRYARKSGDPYWQALVLLQK
jgi:hypothetical protein